DVFPQVSGIQNRRATFGATRRLCKYRILASGTNAGRTERAAQEHIDEQEDDPANDDNADGTTCVAVVERLANGDDRGDQHPDGRDDGNDRADAGDEDENGQQAGRGSKAHGAKELPDIGLGLRLREEFGPYEPGHGRPDDPADQSGNDGKNEATE